MKLNWYKSTKNVEFGQEYEKRTPCGEKVEAHSLSFKWYVQWDVKWLDDQNAQLFTLELLVLWTLF